MMQQQNKEPSRRGCRFCSDKELIIDYKDAKLLKPFLTDRERIVPRRQNYLCRFHQRLLMKAIKKARLLGVVPFASARKEML